MQGSFNFVTRSQIEEGSAKRERPILPMGSHSEVSKALEVPELSGEVERALWQVEQASIKAEKEQEEREKQTVQQVAANEKHEERK